MSGISVLGLDHVQVADRERSAAWFEQVLGLRRDSKLSDWAIDPTGPFFLSTGEGKHCLALVRGNERKMTLTIITSPGRSTSSIRKAQPKAGGGTGTAPLCCVAGPIHRRPATKLCVVFGSHHGGDACADLKVRQWRSGPEAASPHSAPSQSFAHRVGRMLIPLRAFIQNVRSAGA